MASTGKWEVVGKPNKKRANFDKKKDKPRTNGIPIIDVAGPVPQADTIYQAFDKHDKKSKPFDPYEKVAEEKQEADKVQDKKPAKKKPAANKAQKSDHELLVEAMKKVDLDLMKDILAKDQDCFPNNPSLWLKDLASYIHLQLLNVPEKDPSFDDKATDYPSCLLGNDLKSFVVKILKNSSSTTLSLFFQYCMTEMVQELSKGHSAYAMQMMIQLSMKISPRITVDKLEEYEEMLSERKSRPKEALSIMWALGQLPDNNLAHGLKVWTTVMMPMISSKQLSRFSVQYLEKLLQNCSSSSQETLIDSADFMNIMALTLDPQSPLANNHSLKRKMLSMYPKLKAFSFGRQPKSRGHTYFLSLLRYLKCSNNLSVEHLTEVLDCLTSCLENDRECFSIWMEIYPTVLVESSVLIYHIVDTWSTRSSKVPKEMLRKVISTFQVFNSEQEKGTTLVGVEACTLACEAAVEKSKQKSQCCSLRSIFKLILVILIGVITVDLYKHKGYEGSKTCYFAREYGLERNAIRAYGHAKHGFDKGNSWVQENYPAYYSKFREYADPAAAYTWDKLAVAGSYIVEQTKPATKYLNKKIPEILEKIETQAPKYWATATGCVKHYYNIVWPFVHHYLVVMQDLFIKYVPPLIAKLHELCTTLATKIYALAPEFFDSIMASMEKMGQSIAEKVPDVVAVVQEYAIITYNLLLNLVNNTITWVQSSLNSAETDDVVKKQATSNNYQQ